MSKHKKQPYKWNKQQVVLLGVLAATAAAGKHSVHSKHNKQPATCHHL